MHRTSHPFTIPTHIQAQADAIVAASKARFGDDHWRMEDPPAGDPPASDPPPADPPAGDPPADPPAAEKVDDLPDWAQKLIKDTRAEAADHRKKATAAETKQAEALDAIAKALGLKKDEAPDPARLAEQLGQTQAKARQAAVELAVFRTAGKHKGDPDALLDSRTFQAKVSDLDPEADDFASKVDTAIKDAVKDNPKLQAVQVAPLSSADHPGGSGGGGGKPKTLEDAISSKLGVG